jgi:predicted Zn-dependent protease with MMP-like domain
VSDSSPPASARTERLQRYQQARRRTSPRASSDAFESLVVRAMNDLPPFIRDRLENIAVVVEERPEPAKLLRLGYTANDTLLGLYEGIPRHQRALGYNFAVPDRITIYRQPILDEVAGRGPEAVVREVRKTVIHEVAHFFGISDDELEVLEGHARKKPHAH